MFTQDNIYYPKIGKPPVEIVLTEDLILEQWIIPKGATIKTLQSKNFGYIILNQNQKDSRGFVIPRTLFRY